MVKNRRRAGPQPIPKSPKEDEQCSNYGSLHDMINKQSDTISQLLDKINELTERISKLESKSAVNEESIPSITEERIHSIEELIEERTNRQLRKTLVFKGIPEKEDERSWQDTEDILSSVIAETLEIDHDEAVNMIDRCHRGGNRQYYKGKGKARPIYAAMMAWKDCEDLLDKARRKKSILVDFRYGPLTTRRRNLALQKRRELLDNGTFIKAHISYPAVIKGKAKGNDKYKIIYDFSREDVSFKTQEKS